MNGSKYRAKHSEECRNRSETILSETDAGKRRFDAARERRLEGITKKAMEFEDKIKSPTEGSKLTSGQNSPNKVSEANEDHIIFTPPDAGASSGSGMNHEQRSASVTAQNVKDKAAAIEESLKNQKTKPSLKALGKREPTPASGKQHEANDPFKTPRSKKKGHKRRPIEEADDSARGNQPQEESHPQGVKRRSEDEVDDAHRGDPSGTAPNVLPKGNKRRAEDEGDDAHRGDSTYLRSCPQSRLEPREPWESRP